MHILVYMYLFTYRKLDSFLTLMWFTYIEKLGITGLAGSRAARGNITSNRSATGFLASCEDGGR